MPTSAASLISSHYNQRGTQALSPSALHGSINFLPLIPEVILRELQRRRQKLHPIIRRLRGQVISREVTASASGSGGDHRWLSLLLARPKSLLKSWPNCFLHLSLNAQELGVFNYASLGFDFCHVKLWPVHKILCRFFPSSLSLAPFSPPALTVLRSILLRHVLYEVILDFKFFTFS